MYIYRSRCGLRCPWPPLVARDSQQLLLAWGKVAHLRQQLNAHIDRNVLLETRLLSTQDALDDIRASSTEEVQALERENARLIRKCETHERIAREAERENADMKGTILQLIAKGGCRHRCRRSCFRELYRILLDVYYNFACLSRVLQ